MKKPKPVIEAEAALAAKRAEVAAAKDALKRLEAELDDAHEAILKARTEADSALPQCRAVVISRFSGGEKDRGRYVILRRTPGGLLVVRPVGDTSGSESRFKWFAHSEVFRDAKKESFSSTFRELRDVPTEFLPARKDA